MPFGVCRLGQKELYFRWGPATPRKETLQACPDMPAVNILNLFRRLSGNDAVSGSSLLYRLAHFGILQWHHLIQHGWSSTRLLNHTSSSIPPFPREQKSFLDSNCLTAISIAQPVPLKSGKKQQYIRWNDVTSSMITIRSPFCGYNLA